MASKQYVFPIEFDGNDVDEMLKELRSADPWGSKWGEFNRKYGCSYMQLIVWCLVNRNVRIKFDNLKKITTVTDVTDEEALELFDRGNLYINTAVEQMNNTLEAAKIRRGWVDSIQSRTGDDDAEVCSLVALHGKRWYTDKVSVNTVSMHAEERNVPMWAKAAMEELRRRISDTQPEVEETVAPVLKDPDAALARALRSSIKELMKGEVMSELEAMFERARVRETRVVVEHKPHAPVTIEGGHIQLGPLVKMIASGVNVMLVGPPGSGKTTAAINAAQALKVPVSILSCTGQTPESRVTGYYDAQGRYVASQVRKRFETGGLLVLDEFDAWSANTATAMNAILANQFVTFPDATIQRNPKFWCVACANTWGMGATSEFVGRNRLDAATLDRYATMYWAYDETLERKVSESTWQYVGPWVQWVQSVRKLVMAKNLRAFITPRASIMGATLLREGFDPAEVAEWLVFKGMDTDTKNLLKKECANEMVYADLRKKQAIAPPTIVSMGAVGEAK